MTDTRDAETSRRRIAWITGAGSGIGEAAAGALAEAGFAVVLTGRRADALETVAGRIRAGGGEALVQPGDVTRAEDLSRAASTIRDRFGRLDLMVNNAGTNIADRSFAALTPAGAAQLIDTNLLSGFLGVSAALPLMREAGGGLFIHIASWAGRHPSPVSGAAYSAAKQGMIMMSHLLNEEECVNNIRSCVICPAEVATPILDRRPRPVSAEQRGRMLQPADLGDLVRFIAAQPPHVCVNEVVISPTWNRMFAAVADAERTGSG
ncbi:SDR family oxidoreductase [Rhizosaccharibacter radicis]|uniref:SDR family NAD(P)-dependent oxidoreductase n=1 Tax=Rhizosaccharibacter radicis TaxID=2782605 RepID=A0ABT1VVC3_9PROT|nr:SDR family NAD(P)-dependent oxidoreductase [Acetobacteraceae bacterium KSS12]